MNRVREIRERSKMSVTALAKKSGLTVDNLSKIERDERKLTSEKIHALCDALECNPAELLGYTNLKLAADNPTPVSIDDDVFAIAKEVALETMQDQELSFSEEELLDQVMRAYKIGLEIKQKNGLVKPSTLAARWVREL